MTMMAAAAAACLGVADPVIDVHVHDYEQDARFDHRVPNLGTGSPMTVFTGADHARATAAALKAAGVVRGIVGGARPATDDRLIALDPERLRGGYQIDDIPTAAQLAEIRARHAAGQARDDRGGRISIPRHCS